MKGKIFIVSDAHFGSPASSNEEEKKKLFREFLRLVESEAETLVLLGDIFDFWFEYGKVIPKDYFDIMEWLYNLASKVKIYFIAGNHDLWAGEFLEEVGMHVERENLIIEHRGGKIFLAHGDRLRRTDLGGQAVRFIMGNRVSTFLFKLIHPDLGISLAKWVSSLSRSRSSRKNLKNPIPGPVFRLFEEGYRGVILGHVHVPLLVELENGFYMNTGDWMYHFTYGIIEEGEVSLISFKGGDRKTLKI